MSAPIGETDEQVNDRANDAIRVTALEIGAKVIGEGANLGTTQRGRIEFALRGGRINTDAIDNSAGVNTSDVEVNIKIALASAMRQGQITREERDVVLAQMTDEVAHAVLRNNYLQSLAISLGEKRGLADLGFQTRLMHALESIDLLDRTIEQLPSDAELAERRQKRQHLTRPELAVLLAYAKIALYFELIGSPVVDDPYLSRVLADYFPEAMRERFREEIETHALRREIIATMLANAAINRGGSTFIIRLKEETGRSAEDIAYAFAAAMGVFKLAGYFDIVDAQDDKLDGQRQLSLYLIAQDVLRRQTAWFLRHGASEDGLSSLDRALPGRAGAARRHRREHFRRMADGRLEDATANLVAEGVPEDLARQFVRAECAVERPGHHSAGAQARTAGNRSGAHLFPRQQPFPRRGNARGQRSARPDRLLQPSRRQQHAERRRLRATRRSSKRSIAFSGDAEPNFEAWCAQQQSRRRARAQKP